MYSYFLHLQSPHLLPSLPGSGHWPNPPPMGTSIVVYSSRHTGPFPRHAYNPPLPGTDRSDPSSSTHLGAGVPAICPVLGSVVCRPAPESPYFGWNFFRQNLCRKFGMLPLTFPPKVRRGSQPVLPTFGLQVLATTAPARNSPHPRKFGGAPNRVCQLFVRCVRTSKKLMTHASS